jgi:hypothetical protein
MTPAEMHQVIDQAFNGGGVLNHNNEKGQK